MVKRNALSSRKPGKRSAAGKSASKRATNRAKTGPAPRTSNLGAIQRNLGKTHAPTRKSPIVHPYVHCRLDPFSGGNALYPGGGSSPLVSLEHRVCVDFNVNNTAPFHIRLLPCLPQLALYHTTAVTGSNIATDSFGTTTYGPYPTTGPDVFYNWSPLAYAREYNCTVSPSDTAGAMVPYSAMKGRVTSYAYKLYYTGKTLNCRGLITATPTVLSVTHRETNALAIAVRDEDDNVGETFATGTVDSIEIETYTIPNPCRQDSVVTTFAQGCSGRLTQSANDLEFRPISNPGAVMHVDNVPESYIGSRGLNVCGVGLYDESWTPTDLYISSVDGEVEFRLEIVACVEYVVSPNSEVARFTRPAPASNPPVLTALQQALRVAKHSGALDYVERSAISLGKSVMSKIGSAASSRLASYLPTAAMAMMAL